MRNDSPSRALDIDAVRAFALVAELQSFTRAAQVSGTTQSAVSLKLKRLEHRLSERLVERTPRSVRLTAEGAAFLERARDLLAAHDRALAGAQTAERRLTIGISDHVAGPDLANMIARVNAFDPSLVLDVRIDFSHALLDKFDRGELDAVIVRREGNRRGGEKLLEDEFGWFAAPNFRHKSGEKLRLAMLAAPCGVRANAIRALDKANVKWLEAFTGGGVTAVAAAISCGLAVAPLARRIAPPGTLDVGRSLALPPLGRSTVALHSRISDAHARAALRTLAAAFRSMAAT
jgi:DNA-binding transcriptional LysR family regulator